VVLREDDPRAAKPAMALKALASSPKLEIHALWRGATPPPTAARLLQSSGPGFA